MRFLNQRSLRPTSSPRAAAHIAWLAQTQPGSNRALTHPAVPRIRAWVERTGQHVSQPLKEQMLGAIPRAGAKQAASAIHQERLKLCASMKSIAPPWGSGWPECAGRMRLGGAFRQRGFCLRGAEGGSGAAAASSSKAVVSWPQAVWVV